MLNADSLEAEFDEFARIILGVWRQNSILASS